MRILHLEDDPLDAELIEATLAAAGLTVEIAQVHNRNGFVAALEADRFHLILADQALPGSFDGITALAIAQAKCPDVPFIFVSGVLGEELAVEAVKGGATDYVLKQRLSRLGPSVRRAVRESQETARRQMAEQALLASEAELRALLAAIVDVILVFDADGRYLKIASGDPQMLFTPAGERLGKTLHEVLPRDTADLFLSWIRQALDTRQTVNAEYRLPIAGQDRWFSAAISPMLENTVVWVARDTTERRWATEALHRREQEIRALVENAPDIIARFDHDLRHVYVNPAVIRATGLMPSAVIGRRHRDLELPEENVSLWEANLLRVFDTGQEHRIEFDMPTPEGIRHFQARLVPEYGQDGSVEYALGITRDITEQKQSENALRESERRFRALIENIQQVFWMSNASGSEMMYISPAYEAIWGRPVEEVYRQPYSYVDALHPEDRSRLVNALERQLQGEPTDEEYRIIRPDGSVRWIWDRGFPIRDEAGAVQQVAGIAEDISDRKQAQAALAAEKERLAVTLRSIGDGVITTDTEGAVVLLNPVAERLTGFAQADAGGRPVAEVFRIVHEHTRAPAENPVQKVLQTGEAVEMASHTVLLAHDGAERIVADSGAPIRDHEGRVFGVVLVFRDITDQRKLEDEAARAGKLESVGVLAGGIAHDFNNILTAILANLSMARTMVRPSEKVFVRVSEAEKATLRARDLTQQLLTFARGGAPIRKPASIGELLFESATFALTGSNVRPEFHIAEGLWPVEVDAGQFSQVIQNLVLNAQQAMPQGGRVQVRAENLNVAGPSPWPLQKGRHVEVVIQDHGVGIPPEHLDRIFDPYFTTKQRGSGLGLATAFSIIKRHEGHIRVHSEMGAGTRFHIYLPASTTRVPSPEIERSDALKGQGRVLVLDDEAIIREAARAMLSELGYEVELASDGLEAIRLYRASLDPGPPIDVLILDLTIPGGMGGREAVQQLLEINPRVRAIVSSGYANDPIMANFRSYGFSDVVAKPYTVAELSEVVHRAVSAERVG